MMTVLMNFPTACVLIKKLINYFCLSTSVLMCCVPVYGEFFQKCSFATIFACKLGLGLSMSVALQYMLLFMVI